jgi:hypothetical protein
MVTKTVKTIATWERPANTGVVSSQQWQSASSAALSTGSPNYSPAGQGPFACHDLAQ